MTNNIVPIGQARMPAAMKQRIDAGKTTNSNFSAGIRDQFPLLSIKGKVFRIRKDGQEVPMVDPHTRQVIPFLDVILVNAAPTLSKTYFIKGFEDGEFQQPDCWSLDAVKPDPSVVNKVSPTCANCPKNIFGSAMAQDGSSRGGKACSDAKRIAVMMPGHLGKSEPLIFMLRVPATSMKNLKAYSDLLARQGWEPAGCVTRLQFDYQQAYPKLEFAFVDSLDDGEYEEVVAHADGPYVASMLAAPDFDAGVSHPPQNPAVQPRMRQEAPVLDETQTVVETKPQPKQTKADVKQEPAGEPELIELPDGSWLNPATGEIVQKPEEPEQEEQAVDPNVIAMADGRFYNKATKAFVDSQYTVVAKQAEAPAKAKRGRKPKEAAPEQPAEPVQAEAQEENKPATNGNGAVQPAPSDLDAMLKDLIPSRKA